MFLNFYNTLIFITLKFHIKQWIKTLKILRTKTIFVDWELEVTLSHTVLYRQKQPSEETRS